MHSLKTPPTRLVSRFAPETHEIFTKLEWELMWFVERLSFVSSIHAELVRVTRGQRFLIRNLGMWTMLLSERDAIVKTRVAMPIRDGDVTFSIKSRNQVSKAKFVEI